MLQAGLYGSAVKALRKKLASLWRASSRSSDWKVPLPKCLVTTCAAINSPRAKNLPLSQAARAQYSYVEVDERIISSHLSIYLYKAKSPSVRLCVCRSACQAMAAPTAAPIVTKLGLQTLNITSFKLIQPHLRFEAVWRPKSRSKVPLTT